MFHFRFAYCRECRLGFVDPQPNAQVLGAFYPPDYAYWASEPAGFSIAAERLARRDASFTLGLPLCVGRQANILDFGFGSGGFLLALEAMGFTRLSGYDVEASRPGGDRLRQAGIQVFYGDEFARLPDALFDCIRLEHVLEHLPAPIEALSALRAKLRPGEFLSAAGFAAIEVRRLRPFSYLSAFSRR